MKRGMFDRVREAIADVIGDRAEYIEPETTFDDLGWDSLDGLEVCLAVEEEFGIGIPDEDWEAVRSVADILALLDRQPALR